MHHYRVDLNGPPAALAAVAAEVGQESVGKTLVVARDEGIGFWESLSCRHPRVTFGVECFEAFEDELLRAVIQNGQSTVMARHSTLADDWGSFHDEDGEPLDDGLLRAAAELVSQHRLRYEARTHEGGLATALTLGKALGRLCCRVEATLDAAPPGDALDAVIELAVLALWTSTPRSVSSPAERDFHHALRITQSMVHAGRSEFRDEPGDADWNDWLRWLIGSTCDAIDAATHIWLEPENEVEQLGAEHFGTPVEHLEYAARSLLTTCIEALALFGDAHWSAV
jgi:hypothetical protein